MKKDLDLAGILVEMAADEQLAPRVMGFIREYNFAPGLVDDVMRTYGRSIRRTDGASVSGMYDFALDRAKKADHSTLSILATKYALCDCVVKDAGALLEQKNLFGAALFYQAAGWHDKAQELFVAMEQGRPL